jgi:membrane-bound lytic murein transglycosylase A
MPKTDLYRSDYSKLPQWKSENYTQALESFKKSCKSSKTQKFYPSLCQKAQNVQDKKLFFQANFQPYLIVPSNETKSILTGYYESELHGSLTQSKKYKYPIYATPNDLINVDLSSLYPEIKKFRLRGRLEGNKIVPYPSRGEGAVKNSKVICYVDSKIDAFFLEIQGSGRVTLDDGTTLFIGYANQNGHKYRAIGRYLVKIGALKKSEVSLQSIKKWLEEHPQRVDEVLNYNHSVVYFQTRDKSATGSLGLELTPKRSVAVDRSYIPLGSMLYMDAKVDDKEVAKIVMAQDTGGAIKGSVRADYFLGYGDKAMQSAGKLNSPLKLWVFLPKEEL